MANYELKTGEIAGKVVEVYKKIEDGVVCAYKKIEDAFVEKFLDEKEEVEEAETKL